MPEKQGERLIDFLYCIFHVKRTMTRHPVNNTNDMIEHDRVIKKFIFKEFSL